MHRLRPALIIICLALIGKVLYECGMYRHETSSYEPGLYWQDEPTRSFDDILVWIIVMWGGVAVFLIANSILPVSPSHTSQDETAG